MVIYFGDKFLNHHIDLNRSTEYTYFLSDLILKFDLYKKID